MPIDFDPNEYDTYRETVAHVDNGEPFTVKAYGRLEGLLIKFAEPLDNYDAAHPYNVVVKIARHSTPDADQPQPRLAVQSVCRSIGKIGEGSYRGEEPLL